MEYVGNLVCYFLIYLEKWLVGTYLIFILFSVQNLKDL